MTCTLLHSQHEHIIPSLSDSSSSSTNSPNILLLSTPLSNSSLQIIITSASNPKPSGDIFRIAYNEKEIMQFMALKGMQKMQLRDEEALGERRDSALEDDDLVYSDDEEHHADEQKESELAEQVPFEIQQVLGNRLNESLTLPVYRIASFGLKMMQQIKGTLLKEIFLVWGIRMDNKTQEEINDVVRRIEKVLDAQLTE